MVNEAGLGWNGCDGYAVLDRGRNRRFNENGFKRRFRGEATFSGLFTSMRVGYLGPESR